ncbi:uncharacterized protein L201_006206 [Kwoniella dendrophila CBS 6074]|uniref:Uncharacterized protein n=1 Tax=Kwoniella dendrophila CBS 6074 TaxID=1295534 RepID=A0AAX4K2D7_9TREE
MSSDPPLTAKPSSNTDQGIKLQLNIQSLSLDCSIPSGTNFGIQLGVPSNSSQSSNEGSSNHSTNTNESKSTTTQNQNRNQNNCNLNPETFLLGLAISFINRLEKVENDLNEERKLNRVYREKIDKLQYRLDRLDYHPIGDTKVPDDVTLKVARNRKGKDEEEIEIQPEDIDDKEFWQSELHKLSDQQSINIKEKSNNATGEEEEEEEEDKKDESDNELPDDPTGLGLDDNQAILYGFKPRK